MTTGNALPTTIGTPRQGLTGATAGFFVGFAAVALFGPTAARFRDVMGLTPMELGFLVAMPALSGSLLRIPFAAWVDTTGGRRPFLVLLGLSILGMLGISAVVITAYPDRLTHAMYPLLLVLGLFCGAGIATFSVGITQVAYWFPQRRQGAALAIYGGVGNLAPGTFSLLLPFAPSRPSGWPGRTSPGCRSWLRARCSMPSSAGMRGTSNSARRASSPLSRARARVSAGRSCSRRGRRGTR